VKLEVLEQHDDYADFMTRGAKSYRKFVAAHARICNRACAIKSDVDAVFPYVLRKFETVLGWLVGDTSDELSQKARKLACIILIGIKFRGKMVTLEEVHVHFVGLSSKSIERYLDEICGTKNAEGSWSVPDLDAGGSDHSHSEESHDGNLSLVRPA